MKAFSLAGLLLVCTVATAQRPATRTYVLNPASSRLVWTGYAEAGGYAPSGTLRLAPGGTLSMTTPATLQAARVLVDVRTLTHSNEKLQEHLRGTDFFDAARFPTASFELLRIAEGQAQGRLTLKGQTHPVTVPVRVVALGADSLLVQGTVQIDRTQFGINYNSSSFFQNLGSYAIRNDFQLAFTLKAGRQ
ncbi:MAG: YceI family protein [Janthinobacterium lividum]